MGIYRMGIYKITTVFPYFLVRSAPPCSYLSRNPSTNEKSLFLSCQSLINPDKFPQLLSGNSRRKQNITNWYAFIEYFALWINPNAIPSFIFDGIETIVTTLKVALTPGSCVTVTSRVYWDCRCDRLRGRWLAVQVVV